MGLLFLIVAGGVLGWLATIMDRAQSLKETQPNMLVGVGGALLAGLVLGPMLGFVPLFGGHYNPWSILVAVIGSALALVIKHFIAQKRVR